MRTAVQVQRHRDAARHRPLAATVSRRIVPAGVVVGAALLLAATLLALYPQGSLEVARGTSGAPSTAVSGIGSTARSPLISAVLVAEGVRVTVGSVVARPAGVAAEPPAETGEATPTRRVAVYLKVYNVGEKVATFTPLDVALRDVEGEVYGAYSPEWSPSPALPGAALEPGGQVEGWRVFEVPATGLEYVLLYRSDAMDSGVEARLPRLRSGVDEAPLEPLAQIPQEAQVAGGDR